MTRPSAVRATGVAVADRVLDGTAPAPVRSAAARGALPVPREILLPVLVHLATDPDPGIQATAQQSLAKFQPDELTTILGNSGTDPAVLEYFALLDGLSPSILSAVIANPSLAGETISRIASSRNGSAIDQLLLNQARLAGLPAAIDALVLNPSLSGDQRRRLLDFVEHLGAPKRAPVVAEPLGPELLGPVSDEELRSMLGQMSDVSFISLEVGEFVNSTSEIEGADEFADLGESFETVFKQILKMSPPQRLRAALRAGREARQILIRDTSRVVAAAVLRNPRLTDEEIVSFASQKSLSDEILRMIGSNRSWMGAYSVMHNVVRNPKTPLAIAVNNIGRLHTRDLQNIQRDKNIPEAVRRMAKKHFEQREARPMKFKRH